MSQINRIVIDDNEYELPSLPSGGNEGQVLTKGSSKDGDYSWKYYTPKIWKGTLVEYASILEKEDDCLYFIVEEEINDEEE